MLEFKIGVCDVSVELNTPKIFLGMNGYDLVVSHDGYVVKIWENIYAEDESAVVYKSKRFDMAVDVAKRYTVLNRMLDRANNNLMFYSKSCAMDTPMEGYADEWHEALEESHVLERMLKELPNSIC